MNRRHFLKSGLAAGVTIALSRRVARAFTPDPQWKLTAKGVTFTTPVSHRYAAQVRSIDVTGLPTPDWLNKGNGTYHIAGDRENDTRQCFLNGVDVSKRASACDTEAGWVRMFEVSPDGAFTLRNCSVFQSGKWINGPHCVERIHFGKVEVR